MEKMFFSEPQQRVTVGAYGKVLVLLNERKEKPVGDSMGDEMREAVVPTEQYVYDGCWLDTGGVASEAALVSAAKEAVLAEISAHDTSDSVNVFVLDGERGWLEKDTRMGLRQNVSDRRALGYADIVIWVNGKPHTMALDRADDFLRALENYAYACKAVTSGHKAAVAAMSTLEEVLRYDYKEGYPSVIYN